VGVPLDLDREQFVEWLRTSAELGLSRFTFESIATRGERLILARRLLETTDSSVGPSEVEQLFVGEVDDHGNVLVSVVFDPDHLDAAYPEPAARYAAGEARSHPAMAKTLGRQAKAISTRDWEQLGALYAADFLLNDHRRLGVGASRSREEFVA